MLTPEEQELLQHHVAIDGDGNVVGDHATTIKQVGGDYAVQIGEQHFTVSMQDLQRVLQVTNSQVGVIRDHARITGGIHFDQRNQQIDSQFNIAGNYYAAPHISPPPDGRCDYYRHISLPPHYIPRPDLLRQTREALLESDESVALTSAIQQTPAALHGMGGIGKSVLARALCEDSKVQVTFSDGILWMTLGQEVTEATLRSKLHAWTEALGGIVSETAPTLEHLKALLAQILKERACLLIVDDVWRRQDAEAFQVGGPRCRLLITTRDAEIAAGLGARLQPVDVMAQEQALALLEEWARGQLDDIDESLKQQIVGRLGYLPLAVRLAGEQLRRHPPAAWLARFDARRLRSSRPESVHDNLFLTFALSLEDLPERACHCYLALVIFPEDEPIPLAALSRLWGARAGLDDLASRDLLHDLVARALAQLDETDHGLALTLHDLLRDFIADQLGQEGIRDAHRALLEAYRATQAGAGWPTTPDDGYLYNHLAYHLDTLTEHDATAQKELRELFVDDAWLHARVPADDYRYDGYLADLARVWRRVHAQAIAESAAGKPVRAIAASVHCALIQTTVNALATTYPPELVARAVETGLWSPERGLSVLQRVADASKQVRMAASLLSTGRLSEQQCTIARRAGLASTHAIEDEWLRVEALAILIPHLEEEIRQQTLTKTLTAARTIKQEGIQAKILMALAPHLEGILLTEALSTARGIKNERWQVEALTTLAPHVEENVQHQVLAEALTLGHTLQDERTRARVLTALIPHLGEKAREQALTKALATARAITNELWQVKALMAVALHLEEDGQHQVLAEALAIARTLQDEWRRAMALTALARHLGDSLLTEALAATRAVRREWQRARILMALFPHLRGSLLDEALAAARALQVKGMRAKVLAVLALQLEEDAQRQVLIEALTAVHNLRDEEGRAKALTALALHLKEEVRQQVLVEALAAARALPDEDWRAMVLMDLAPHFGGALLPKVLVATHTLQDEAWRARILTALAPHLKGPLLTEALAAIRVLQDEESQAEALVALAPHLEGSLLTDAFATALTFRQEAWQVMVLMALAPHLKASLLTEALAAAYAVKSENWQVEALTTLVPHLEEDDQHQVLADAFTIARAIEGKGDRIEALTVLAPYLEGKDQHEILVEACAATFTLQDEGMQAEAIIMLAPHLVGSLLAKALAATCVLQDEENRARALAVLAPQLEDGPLNNVRAALAQCLWVYRNRTLRDLLNLLAQKEAVFLQPFNLSAEDYALIAQSIIDINTQWEWL